MTRLVIILSYELNNEKNLKCSVLFSDLYGTLLDENSENASWEDCKQNFKKISPFLNSFLNKNNFLAIITSANHLGIQCCLEIIQEYLEYINQENRKNIFWFISEKDWMNCGVGFGDSVYLDEMGITVNLIVNKVESVDIVLEKLKDYKIKDIGAIGDGFKEFDLLTKIHDLGGVTGIIGGSFNNKIAIENALSKYNNENKIDKLIKGIADVEYEIYLSSFVTDFHNKFEHSQLTIKQFLEQLRNDSTINGLKRQKDIRIKELQDMVDYGLITEDDLERIIYLDIIVKDRMCYVPLNDINLEYAQNLINQTRQIGANFSIKAVSEKTQLLKSYGNIKMLFNK